MFNTNSLVHPEPFSSRSTTTASHPQLRDLLVYTPSTTPDSNSILTATYDSLASHSLYNDRTPRYTPLGFSPCCVTQGCGLVAAGGQNSEIVLKSIEADQTWCYQYIPHPSSSSDPHIGNVQGSIVNSLNISPSPANPSQPRLLLSSNDEMIKVFDVVGDVPDWKSSKRVRESRRRERKRGWTSIVDQTYQPKTIRDDEDDQEEESEEEVEESTSFNRGGECKLIPRPELDILHLSTPINHCSLSSDGTKLVAVGDTDQVFLFDVRGDEYQLRTIIQGEDGARRDASFSTDWDDGHCFVVGSQDGFVTVYDQRQLPSSSSSTTSQRTRRTVAEFETTQRLQGPTGAVRKVKFSPGGRGNFEGGLLAFTEHRRRIHLIDARNFETSQILEIPTCASSSTYHSQLQDPPSSPWHNLRVPSPGDLDDFPPARVRPHPGRAQRGRGPRIGTRRRRRRSSTHDDSEIEWTMEGTERDSRVPPSGGEFSVTTRTRRRIPPSSILLGQDSGVDDQDAMRSERERHDQWNQSFLASERGGGGAGGEAMEMPDEGMGQVWPTPVVLDRENRGGTSHGLETSQIDSDDDSEDEEEEEDSDEEDSEEEEEEGEGSNSSSINTTRPRRFSPLSSSNDAANASTRRTYSSIAASGPTVDSRRVLDDNIPYTTLSRYSTSPVTPNPPLSLFAAPLLTASERSSTPTVPSSTRLPRIYPFSVPTYTYSHTNVDSGNSRVYRTMTNGGVTHNNFPTDTSELDLLGMDWDEFEERLLVATGKRVWEWDVDKQARRCKGSFDFA
ncbi:WD40 repeat domain-containing protein [Sporobolomyces salmoneus]|uniref:WD40 repeat domain-containing protein n=1 Tax=Sporobolomyces salmoneus TaxID=183962 RepID=UPI0031751461